MRKRIPAITKDAANSIMDKLLACRTHKDGNYDGRLKTVLHLTKNEAAQLFNLLDETSAEKP